MRCFLREFVLFGLKQVRACLFAGTFLALILVSKHVSVFGLARYDFLFLGAVAIQIALVWTGVEPKHELMTLCACPALGISLDLFKTHPARASWTYPEGASFKPATLPPYSASMY